MLATLAGCPGGERAPAPPVDVSSARPTAATFDGVGHIAAADVALHPDGDALVVGTFDGRLDLGATDLIAAGGRDVFVARLDDDGAARWAHAIGGPGSQTGPHIASSGDRTLLSLAFRDSVTLGETTIEGRGAPSGLVAGLGPDGAPRWHTVVDGSRYVRITDLAADETGAVAVGLFAGTMRAGDHVLTSAGAQDLFVLRLDPDGRVVWAVRAGGPLLDAAHGVAMAGDRVAVAGSFTVVADWGSTRLTGSEESQDAFVALLDSDGALRWARRLGGDKPDTAFAVALGDGVVYAGGTFWGRADIGGTPLESRGMTDSFVAAFDDDGGTRWVQRLGGEGADELGQLAAAGDTLIAAGSFRGRSPLGPADLESAGGHDGFVAGLAPASGTVTWARRVGGDGQDAVSGLSLTAAGRYAVAGSFAGSPPVDTGRGRVADVAGFALLFE